MTSMQEAKKSTKITADNIAKTFELRVLFHAGRHFWNAVALSGFIAIGIGSVAAVIYSVANQDERKLSKQIKPVPEVLSSVGDFDSWFRGKCLVLKPKRGYTLTKHRTICGLLPTQDDRKKYTGVCSYQDWNGDLYKPENKSVRGRCTVAPAVSYDFLDGYRDDFKKVHAGEKDVYLASLSHSNSIKSKNDSLSSEIASLKFKRQAKATFAGIIAAVGLGIIAVSSLLASLLAIERNTRQKES